jgi:pimeloyl-ACP methyl ester carboxylesterase
MMLLLTIGLAALALGGALAAFTHWTARRVEAALPRAGRMVAVPGGHIHVQEQGAGPAILLIHGLGGQACHYTYRLAGLLAEQYRVVTVDRPGSGYSERDAAHPADLGTQADALAALIDALQLGAALVVGHSLGGAVALALAQRHPDKVKALALLAPLTQLPEEVPPAFRALTIESHAMRQLLAWTVVTPASIARSKEVLGQVFAPEAVPHDYAVRGGGLLSLRPSQFLSACADMQAVPDAMPGVIARYSAMRVPVSVLYGRQDRILDWEINGKGLTAQLPGSTLELVDGGHMLPVTQPELCARFIMQAAQNAWTEEALLNET